MKKHLTFLLSAGIFLTSHAQDASKDPYMVKQLSGDVIEHVKAETNGGNINVAGVDAAARIEVYVWPGNSRDRNMSKEEIRKRLDEQYDLNVTVENHNLTAIAKQKKGFNNWNNGLSISFKIYIPHNASNDLRTSGGNISLTSLTGTQEFTTSGGNLEIDHLSGHIKGRTSGGNIDLTDLQDDIDLTTSGGNITAQKSHGTIRLSTSGGDLQLNGLQGNIRATTSGGNVHAGEIDGELFARTSGGNIDMKDLSCSLETSTSGGNIEVSIKTLGKFVKINNSGGDIDLQIPKGKGVDISLSGDKVTANGLDGFKGDVKKDRVEGSLNGGGIPISVHGGSHVNFTQK